MTLAVATIGSPASIGRVLNRFEELKAHVPTQ
jgi:hypothetical protein